ncbi:hypothetical protein CKM354_000085600 [Cercospora kikuchii]|uniref:Uncharacterized protein n=1 Tax=Cercospora kikuchii TaxID=84275 RepID=A0A9P3FCC0_9PEZI|nr:uncharacterized protein CKM354_000085600 [Cercospora kikuchii]GIZ37410.1 hypothetical protein CKM354_000085600 [Cercospora kikuchii]
MRAATVLSVLLTFIVSLAAAVGAEREVKVFAWPSSADQPQPLATVSYTSNNASIKSYTPPTIPTGDDVVRVGFYHDSGDWSAVATSASNFAPAKSKKLQLHVRQDGELYHLGFKTSEPVSQGKGRNTVKDLNVEVVKIKTGPKPALNKPIVVTADGEVEGKEPEKSFLQKYWWAIALFLVVQVVAGGGKAE